MATQTYDPNRGRVSTAAVAAPAPTTRAGVTRRAPARVSSGPGALPASNQMVTRQEISGGFATNPESAGMTFMKNGAFSNSSEALTAARAAGVHIGAGDIQNYFVSNSRYRPSVAETISPGSTWQREKGVGPVAPTNPVNPTWNAPGSPGNEPGGAAPTTGGLLTRSVTQNEIDNGFATGPDSEGLTFMQEGGFSNSSEALTAARNSGVHIGAGDLQNYFVNGSSVRPSNAETTNPGSTWQRQNVNGTNEVVAPTNPVNSTWNAQGSPGNNPGGAVPELPDESGGDSQGVNVTGTGSPGNNPGGTTVGEVGTNYGTSVAQPGVKAADAAMAVRSNDALVENRMKGLLSEGSDWKRMAEQNGKAMANRRGLLNSSIGASAAYGEAIKAALPIAQQDARTTATYDLADQANSQQTSLVNAGAENTAANLGYQTERGIEGALQTADQAFKQKGELNNQAFANETSLTAQKGDIESNLIGQRGDIATDLQTLKTENAKDLLGIENEYKNTIATNSNASAIMQTYVNEIGDLMAADKKFTAEQLRERTASLRASLQGSLRVLSGVSGIDWSRFGAVEPTTPWGTTADVTAESPPIPSILTPEQAAAVQAQQQSV